MSKYWPIENYIYKTKLSKEEAIQKLAENLEKEKAYDFEPNVNRYAKPYVGKIQENSFEIKRAISHLNAFLPRINGEVFTEIDGTKIEVKMKLSNFVFVFMAIWFMGIFWVFCLSISEMLTKGFSLFFLLPIVMFVAGSLLIYYHFKPESAKSKQDLMRIFEAEIEQ